MIGSSRETSRQDSHDSHHRRKGEEDIKRKEDIKEQEPYDKKDYNDYIIEDIVHQESHLDLLLFTTFPCFVVIFGQLVGFPLFFWHFGCLGSCGPKSPFVIKTGEKRQKDNGSLFRRQMAKLDKKCYQTWEKTPKGQMFGGGSHKSPDD